MDVSDRLIPQQRRYVILHLKFLASGGGISRSASASHLFYTPIRPGQLHHLKAERQPFYPVCGRTAVHQPAVPTSKGTRILPRDSFTLLLKRDRTAKFRVQRFVETIIVVDRLLLSVERFLQIDSSLIDCHSGDFSSLY